MLRSRFRRWLFTLCGVLPLLSGCLALSFGGKSEQVENVVTESPQTQERLRQLEARMDTLEQQVAPQLSPPVKTN